jgi:hypothetical protein
VIDDQRCVDGAQRLDGDGIDVVAGSDKGDQGW